MPRKHDGRLGLCMVAAFDFPLKHPPKWALDPSTQFTTFGVLLQRHPGTPAPLGLINTGISFYNIAGAHVASAYHACPNSSTLQPSAFGGLWGVLQSCVSISEWLTAY